MKAEPAKPYTPRGNPAPAPTAQPTPTPAPATTTAPPPLDQTISVREAMAIPAHMVVGMPDPVTLTFDGFAVSCCPASYAELRTRGEPVLTGDEWLALVAAAEAGRATHAALAGLIERKRAAPHAELTERAALGGTTPPPAPPRRRMTVAQVARAWGTRLRSAHC